MEWIIINFIEAILISWFISSLLDVEKNKNVYRFILFVVNFSIITLSNYISMYDIFLTTIIIAVNLFVSCYFVNNDWYEILFVVCLEAVYNVAIIVITAIIINIFGIPKIDLISKILYFIFGAFIINYLKNNKLSFNKKIYLMISFILLCLQMVFGHFLLIFLLIKNELTDIYISLIVFLICCIGLFFVMIEVSKIMKEQHELKLLKQEIDNEKTVAYLYEQLKITKHDLKHNFDLLDYYLNENRYDKIQEYVSEKKLIVDSMPTFVQSKNQLINAIINNKIMLAYANQLHIVCHIEVDERIEIDDYDLNELLSNILDNAIEYCSKQGNIHIEIIQDELFLHMKVENDILNNDIDMKTKKDKCYHGYGIKSIKRIIQKYKGSLDITIDKTFELKGTLLLKK